MKASEDNVTAKRGSAQRKSNGSIKLLSTGKIELNRQAAKNAKGKD
jgi:hypothetical protein